MEIVIPSNIIFLTILTLLLLFIVWLIVSYYVLKWFKMKVDKENVFFNEYNEESKIMLEKYGDLKIKNMYLVRQPIERFSLLLGNLVTFYKYREKLKERLPRHTYLLIEVQLKNKSLKTIMIEKNNYLKITGNYDVAETQEKLKLRLGKREKKMTLKEILDITKKRMGVNKYFNWHIHRNNCHSNTKEVLKTLKVYNEKNQDFICEEYDKETIPEFNLHIINTLQNVYHIAEGILGVRLTFWHGGRF
jgi:hypothetical protein